jgi:ankyrin repeat protein
MFHFRMLTQRHTSALRWGIVALVFASWIPLNLWLRRHDSVLLTAVREGDLKAAQQAVKDGANVNMSLRGGYTLLHVAALYTDNVEMVRFLVEHGVPTDTVNSDGDTAANIADHEGRREIAAYLSNVKNAK